MILRLASTSDKLSVNTILILFF